MSFVSDRRTRKWLSLWGRSIWFYLTFLFIVFGFDYYVLSFSRVKDPVLPTTGVALQLLEDVKILTQKDWGGRKPKTEGNRAAAAWIEERMKICGIRSFASLHSYRQTIHNDLGDNVIGFKSAENKSDQWIVVGAHFDHLGEEGFFKRVHWGADDNASSVAVMLETACTVPFLKNTNIVFVAYNTEEHPYFVSDDMGSQVFVDRLPIEVQSIVLSISMDLLGGAHWEPLLNSLFVVGGSTGEGLTQIIAKTNVPNLKVAQMGFHAIERLPMGMRSPVSDYVPYLDRKIPSLLLSVGRTPRYHTPSDTYETLDYFGMEKRMKWLIEFLVQADGFNGKFTRADEVDLALEREGLREYAQKASNWMTRVPGSSLISLYHFKRDVEDLEGATNDTERRILIEKIIGRFQCSMMNLPVCFLID